MTRKTCNNNNTHVGIALDSVCDDVYGYDHSRLRCRKTVAHQRFTRRNSRFLHIDDLYRSDSTITKLFLKINDIALNQTLTSLNSSSPPTATSKSTNMTRNKLLRRQASMYDKLKSPVSPTNSDSCFHLRTRRHTSYVSNFIDSSGDDDSNSIKPMRELRSTSKLLLAALKTSEQRVWDSGRPKRQIKPKRFSIDDDSKDYCKAELKKNKLKTPNNNNNKKKPRISLLKSYTCDSEDEKAIIASNKKKRESELTRLNNEAENFLFPKSKDETSSVESEDHSDVDSRKATPVSNKNDFVNDHCISKLNKSFKSAHEEESRDSTLSETSFCRRKRRLTQAEAFILDNQQYYKFETPGSRLSDVVPLPARLRYHGTYLPPLVTSSPSSTSTTTTTPAKSNFFTKNNGDLISKHLKVEEPIKRAKKKYNLDKLQFSFEVVPNREPWYETFQRQDNGEEQYINCYGSLTDEKKILLPYELGAITPLNPRVCLYAYQELKKSLLGETISISHTDVCRTPDSCSLDATKFEGDDRQSSADCLDSPFNLRSRNRFVSTRKGPSKTPRKSPRQHASTLAILSSLIQPRKRKPKQNLSIIQEEKESKPDYNAITEFFNSCLEDLDPIEIEQESIDCNVHCKPSAVRTLEDYLNVPFKSKSSSKQLSDRKTVRKKRTNKTGWPNKSKKSAFKKEGSHSSGSIIETTDNNSKNDDSKENKLNGIKTDIETKSGIIETSAGDKMNCVNVDLAKWEKAERLLSAKLRSDFQPVVRVQKLANNIIERRNQIVTCSKPKRSMPASPKSPRMLRRPRDKFN